MVHNVISPLPARRNCEKLEQRALSLAILRQQAAAIQGASKLAHSKRLVRRLNRPRSHGPVEKAHLEITHRPGAIVLRWTRTCSAAGSRDSPAVVESLES